MTAEPDQVLAEIQAFEADPHHYVPTIPIWTLETNPHFCLLPSPVTNCLESFRANYQKMRKSVVYRCVKAIKAGKFGKALSLASPEVWEEPGADPELFCLAGQLANVELYQQLVPLFNAPSSHYYFAWGLGHAAHLEVLKDWPLTTKYVEGVLRGAAAAGHLEVLQIYTPQVVGKLERGTLLRDLVEVASANRHRVVSSWLELVLVPEWIPDETQRRDLLECYTSRGILTSNSIEDVTALSERLPNFVELVGGVSVTLVHILPLIDSPEVIEFMLGKLGRLDGIIPDELITSVLESCQETSPYKAGLIRAHLGI